MSKLFRVFVMLIIPTVLLWLLFKGIISLIIKNTADFTLIGQNIASAVPYILIANHSIVFLILLVVLYFEKLSLRSFNLSLSPIEIIGGLIVGALLVGFQQFVTLPVLTHFGLFQFHGGFPGWVYFVSGVLFAGVIEELVFRGYGLTALRRLGVNQFLAVIISTLSFCLLHYGQGWAGVINAGLLGIGLSIWYLKRGNLASTMVAHATFNFLVLLIITLHA